MLAAVTDAAGPLVSTSWLAQHLDDPEVVVADVRWYLSGKRGADEHAKGHVPGAQFVDLDTDLARPRGQGPGRHPLPSLDQLRSLLARLGAGERTTVVAYDDAGGAVAARLWWLLRHVGHPGGRVLDGGIQAWVAQGRPLETAVRTREPRPPLPLPLGGGARPNVVDRHGVQAALAQGALVLDARAAERYEGKLEPVDARPGHVPGAVSAPFAGNLDAPGGRFLPAADLKRRYEALGLRPGRPVIAYCGSGVTACHTLLALELAGRPDAALYEGSWSDWAADPHLPAATGLSPSGEPAS